ncbi:microcystin degradation protein MlrC [Brachybacterium avium]|uniref:Microcystin degradation protein MlrC n=1 Tax=Brachybacterium avium TaxID=2017485 RepID=A0A220UCC8_9MICO|nr:M81 family metallopeptidase [Brachybacterium avium]ASK65878.1 microcystin degradation protein MlrC [Brachybacterium avium]
MTTSLPRIGIAGIAIESSTFTPYRSGADDFEVRRGTAEILDRYPFQVPPAEYVGVLHARALPGGQLDRAVYEGWKAEIVEGLAAAMAQAPLDGLFFDIHGAMSVVGLDDAEGDLITAIRGVIGAEVVVGTAMDLHGNVSHTLFEACDLLTCYRHAPHIDAWETRERGLRDLVETAARVRDGGPLPHTALVHVPILLPGEKTSTRIEPAKSLYARIPGLTERPGVTDVSYWIGFAWADQPRCQAAIVAFGDGAEAVEAAAMELATAVWEQRHEFEFVAPTGTFEDCLDQAIASNARPFWISDSGDNPGAGGADDTTHALAQLAAREEIRADQVSALMVSLVDPATTDAAWSAGQGGRLAVQVGANIDAREPGPVPLAVEVAALDESAPTGRSAALRVLEAGPSADPSADPAALAAARPTGLTVVVTARRSQWATASMFARLGLSMTGFDIVTVKMGYLEPEQYEAAADWLLALTPGGVDQDLLRLSHSRIPRPMIPFDAEIPAPTAADVVAGGGRRH